MLEAAARAVLLVCEQGWNRSVLDAMTVPDDMPGAGEDGLDIYRAEIRKRRRPPRTRHTTGPEFTPENHADHWSHYLSRLAETV